MTNEEIERRRQRYTWYVRLAKRFGKLCHPYVDAATKFALSKKAMIFEAFDNGVTQDDVTVRIIDQFLDLTHADSV